MLRQDPDRSGIDAHGSLPAALRRALHALACDHGRRSTDPDLEPVEVDVGPPQIEQLTATTPEYAARWKNADRRCFDAARKNVRSSSVDQTEPTGFRVLRALARAPIRRRTRPS
jgi:hypothetical protein